MKDERDVPHSSYSIDEILAEEEIKKNRERPPQTKKPRSGGTFNADNIVRSAREALNMDAGTIPPSGGGKPDGEKKKKHRFFGRKKRQDDFVPEDDIYYGLQLKSLEEYRHDYEETIRLDTATLRRAEESARERRRQLLTQQKRAAEKSEEKIPEAAAAAEQAGTAEVKPAEKSEEKTPEAAAAAEQAGTAEVKPAEKSKERTPEAAAAAEQAGTAEVKPTEKSEEKTPEAAAAAEQAGTAEVKPAEKSEERTPEAAAAAEQAGTAEVKPAEKSEEKAPEAAAAAEQPAKSETAVMDERQGSFRSFLHKTGLDEKDVFGAADKHPNPCPPAMPPRPDLPPTEPPVPPAVLPGPQSQPEIGIPAEPPLGPAGIPAPGPLQPGIRASNPGPAVQENSPAPTEPAAEAIAGNPASEATPVPEAEEIAAIGKEPAGPEKPVPVKEPAAPPRAKDESPAPPAEKEPAGHPLPQYRVSSRPLHVISLNCLEDTLRTEAAGYETPPIHAPEPIPFPAPDRIKRRAEKAETEKGASAEHSEAEKTPDGEAEQKDTGKVVPLPVPERPEEPETENPKRAGKRFRVFGSDEDPSDTGEIPKEPEETLDDYGSPSDAPSIRNDLLSQVRRCILRLTATAICTAVMILLSVLWEHPAVLPQALHTPQTFLAAQLIFLATAAAFCGSTIRSGLQGLFTFQANTDSAVSVAVLAAGLQVLVFLFLGVPENCPVYASLAALALFLNSAGKLSMAKRILRNFRFLTSSSQKYAVQMFGDFNTALQLTKGLNPGEPQIAYQTKAGFLEHFLRHSYSLDDPSEHVSQYLAPIGFLASLVLCIVSAVLTRNFQTALTAFTVSACVCVPFADLLSVSLPLARLGKLAAKCGGMTVGWDAVQRFSGTNAVLLDAQDLFPHGTVVLTGIQTFAGQRIDEAILDATALTQAVGGPLSDLFSQIVKSRRDILPHIERPAYEDGLGISGTVRDRLILVGTGGLLKKHGIDPPSRDYESKYLRAGKIPVYLASGGILIAMFLVSYRSDRRRATELRRLEYNGINLLVRTRDPNITPELIADCFGLSPHFISVLPDRDGNTYRSLRDNPPKRASAVIATKGRATSMMRILTACMRQHGNITVGVALQTAGAALGFALAAFFTACNGLAQFSVTALLLFEGFWALAVVLIPRIRRP